MIVLGSTGSIGVNTLEIAKKFKLPIDVLVAGNNIELLNKQLTEFNPRVVVVASAENISKVNHTNVRAGVRAVLEEIGTHFRVTLSTKKVTSPSVDEKDQEILNALTGEEGHSTSKLAQKIGLSTRATRTRLIRLIERGLVYEIGSSPQDPKHRYYRSE